MARIVGFVAVLLLSARVSCSWASLADDLARVTSPSDLDLPTAQGRVPIPRPPNFVGSIVEKLAVRGIDFPPVSTTPGATFRYNKDLGIFERSSGNLGPVFVERADTIGEHQLDLGFYVLYGDLDSIDGGDFGPTYTDTGVDVEFDGELVPVLSKVDVRSFSLKSTQMSFSATFGLTDRWDVNLLLPLIYNDLSVTADQSAVVFGGPAGQVVAESRPILRDSANADAFGPGDLQVRTKYRILDDPLPLAAGLSLRLPSGDPDNFMGLGDVTLTPYLVVSRVIQRYDFHASVGIEANASDVDSSRGIYALGITAQIIEPLAFFFDFVGASMLTDVDLDVPGSAGSVAPKGVDQDVVTGAVSIPRSDYLNIVSGFKFALPGRVVGFLGAIVPVNDSGLRADVLPTGGIEVTF